MRRSPPRILLITGLLLLAGWRPGEALSSGGDAPAEPAKTEAPADGHGAPAGHGEEKGDAHGEGKAEGEVKKIWKEDPPLNGCFDLKTLRSRERVTEYRHELSGLTEMVGIRRVRRFSFSLVIEFGGESGMAELGAGEKIYRDDLQRVARRFSPEELLAPEGKELFKEEAARVINRRLATAQVRQIYLTEFFLMRTY